MIIYTHQFLSSLIFTIVVEIIVVFILLRIILKIDAERLKSNKILFSGIFASFSTIPYVWYIFPILIYWSSNLSLIFSEIFAVFIESLIYYFILEINYKKSLIISLVANFTSFYLGYVLKG